MRRVRKIYFEKAEDVPNSMLPVLLYRSVLPLHAAGKGEASDPYYMSATCFGLARKIRYAFAGAPQGEYLRRITGVTNGTSNGPGAALPTFGLIDSIYGLRN